MIFFAMLAMLLLRDGTTTQTFSEDISFDLAEDFQPEVNDIHRPPNKQEMTAYIGKFFYMDISKDSFRSFESLKVTRSDDASLPLWFLFDEIRSVFWGVPFAEDVGTLNLVITSFGNITKHITIHIRETSVFEETSKCSKAANTVVLYFSFNREMRAIKPTKRVSAVKNLVKLFGLPYSAFTFIPQAEKGDIAEGSRVLAASGNFNPKLTKYTTILEVFVQCDEKVWLHTAFLLHQLKQLTRDGTITELLGLPLNGWKLVARSRSGLKVKRELDDYGSGDDDDDYYYDDNYDDETFDEVSSSTTLTSTHPHRHHHGEDLGLQMVGSTAPISVDQHLTTSSDHDLGSASVITSVSETTPAMVSTFGFINLSTTTNATTEKTTEKATEEVISTTLNQVETSTSKVETSLNYEDYDDYDFEIDGYGKTVDREGTINSELVTPKKNITETTTLVENTSATLKSTVEDDISGTLLPTVSIKPDSTLPIFEDTELLTVYQDTSLLTTELSSLSPAGFNLSKTRKTSATVPPSTTELMTTAEKEEISTVKLATRYILTSPKTTDGLGETEVVEYEEKNFPPYVENRLQQMSVSAGKIFRFVVPKDTFKDFEDGYNLTLKFLNLKGEPLLKDSWCHFNSYRREIYGLPLEEDISKWEYVLKATDRDGASVSDRFTIQVQQHKLQRVVNHEISLQLRLEKPQEFPHFVDWSLKILRALGRIYSTNMTEITVRNISRVDEAVLFTWTNDSIPTNYCPTQEIDVLYKMLTANDYGDPKQELSLLLAPELRVKKVIKHVFGVCKTPQVQVTPPTNFSPFLRNPVDHINATVGELLIFKVPDDTFYDPEDTDSRNLNISLLTTDRQALKPTNWLQFDAKNREFYGIPQRPGRSEYQLVCVDSGGSTATDSLEIVVYPAPKVQYNVEFSMTVETFYETFVKSASVQRKFVEKLQEIFLDRNSSFIHLAPFKQKDHSTIITWYNKSLNTLRCPHDEINHLESMLKNQQDRSISSRVSALMEPEFQVSTISVMTMGICRAKLMPIPPPTHADVFIPSEDKTPNVGAEQFQYLMTFIVPAVIILIMLFLAASTACVLYRRRKFGKMNVEEDGRQTYGNKGIPVIFQEELEEKPESGTKAPVVLKDEKPPLAPPDYSKSGSFKLTDDSEPYHPPPPFTRTQDNGRQQRTKHTPTYRKPPPYVPP